MSVIEQTKEETKKVRFVDLSRSTRELYDELGITWYDIYITARFSSRFVGVCIIAFAEDISEIFVICSGILDNREKEIKALAEKLSVNENINYDKIAIEIAKSLLSSDISRINVYDVSEYESAYLIAIPH